MTYAAMLLTFGLVLLAFAVWRDVFPLLERLVAIRERVSAPTITTVATPVSPINLAASTTSARPLVQGVWVSEDVNLEEPPPQPPIPRAIDDVAGEDTRLRNYLNRVTVPTLKAAGLDDDEIAERLRDGAQ